MEYQLIKTPIQLDYELSTMEKIIVNRGILPENIEHFLNTTDEDILNPELINNIQQGAKILFQHISAGDKIFLQVDPDVDGFTSAALFINYFNDICPGYVQNNIYYRLHTGKQHGLILDTIPEDVKLVIALDSSSNDYEIHSKLAEKGIDVLVIDHHKADRVSESAIIINNQLDDYPTKSLSGVGMTYKFCCYLDKMFDLDYADNYLDLVALGLIADMVNTTDYETKHLISKGIKQINNPFFKGMVKKNEYSLKDGITPIGVAFYVAPYINATLRVGTQQEKDLLFSSMLNFRAYELIPSTKRGCSGQKETRMEQAVRTCCNVKSRQTKARDTNVELMETIIQEKNLLNNKILAIKLKKEQATDPNLTGLIANQLMAKYQRPVLLLNEVQEEDKIYWRGSARGYNKSELADFREFLNKSGLTEWNQGHGNAFGSSVPDENFDALIEYANIQLADFDFSPCYHVDFIYYGNNFKSTDILDIAELNSLWGQGFEEAYIAIEHINVYAGNITLMSPDKHPTIKISLSNGVDLMKFKSSKEEYERLRSETGCITLNIVGTCSINEWMGRITPQVFIEDYEIVSEQKYYF